MIKLEYEIYVVTKTGHMYEFASGITQLTEALHVLRQTASSIDKGLMPETVRAELVTVTRTILS
ncbi:MAG: hypothetical protein [Caudoviricetes sp.]|nr:MAG: hypothetical protein [Caudoviricetes sp.]